MPTYARIKQLESDRGWSLQTLATKAGIGINNIYRWRTMTPTTGALTAVAAVLEVSVDYLLGHTDEPELLPKARRPNVVDLKTTNVFIYEGDQVEVTGLDSDDWAIIKAVIERNRKNRKMGK
ncbi:helix-turn-helix domain-containing protein [Lacticaseibacillus porcinae]|uniref:helix-turn-helix domain-containing protein n=1 Tax=Lacticaseibacillus porcinae TaxID=1123687 RepID=UPI000F786016|nr:helix-turn-helix transcriptional regulator [Lacticaseibacillus porcinae]